MVYCDGEMVAEFCIPPSLVRARARAAIVGRGPPPARVVLGRIVRWQGSRAALVDLGEVRDTLLALTMEYNSAEAVLGPYQAVLIAKEARGLGVCSRSPRPASAGSR